MKWFSNVTTLEELRKEYRQLMKKHHPDVGGSTEDAKAINAEYDRLFAILSRQEVRQEEGECYDTAEEDRAIRVVLDALAMVNADVEIIGSWVWITHGSYPYRELLKSMGFKFAPKKKAWCWHYGEYHRHHKREISLAEIREKYGSQHVRSRKRQVQINA